MNPMPEISTLLKKLNLSGVSENLPLRNQEAIANKLSFTEFLATLLQDEINRVLPVKGYSPVIFTLITN